MLKNRFNISGWFRRRKRESHFFPGLLSAGGTGAFERNRFSFFFHITLKKCRFQFVFHDFTGYIVARNDECGGFGTPPSEIQRIFRFVEGWK